MKYDILIFWVEKNITEVWDTYASQLINEIKGKKD